MTNKILNNLFDINEIEEINKLINNKSMDIKIDDPELGRVRLNLGNNLPNNITNKLNNYAKEQNKNLIFSGCYYVEYNKKYGTPSLAIHTDTTTHTFTLDYQLDSNIDWGIYVEGTEYHLNNNDALTINVVDQAHWRPQRTFNNNEYVKMIFFHFKDITNPNPRIKTKDEMDKLRKKWYSLW